MSRPRLDAWPPLPLASYLRRPARSLPFPLDREDCRVFHRARHGLWRALGAVGLRAGEEVLVPAYHHGSEVEALVRAGLECRFYDATHTLEPDETELERLLGPGTRALHLVHYLGFPQDMVRWRRWCDERGLLLIEDAAQAWLAERDGMPVGSAGDIAIFSLYKTFGLPDGGAVVSRAPVAGPRRERNPQRGRLANRHKAWLSQRWPLTLRFAGGGGGAAAAGGSAERMFDLGDAGLPPARATRFLLPRLFDAAAPERRRQNYARLEARLGALVPPPFETLPPGASPFAFPVRTDDKPRLLERLREGGVLALDLWSVPHPALAAEDFPGAAARRASDVGLPVHQELTGAHLDQIIEASAGG